MAKWRNSTGEKAVVSHTGAELTRAVAFRFALDPTVEQEQAFWRYAGARRFTFNHHLARAKANITTRAAELEAGIPKNQMTPAISWSKVSFIQEFNDWKNGKLDSSPENEDGSRGLSWRGEVAGDVFECASVDAAQALANYKESRRAGHAEGAAFGARKEGARAGIRVGFPRFKARNHTTPSFRLRSRSAPGETAPVRITGPKAIRLPTIGEVRVHGCTRRVRRMLQAGRFRIHSATLSYTKGRWWVSLNGVAAEFHHQRRSPAGRHTAPAGLDRGVKSLAVLADADGNLLKVWEGVNALRSAQVSLRRANKALARTKPGSGGRARARKRLTTLHARIAYLRQDVAHKLSHELATTLRRLSVEDLNLAGMVRNRHLARAVSDAAMGEVTRQLAYKAGWYGLELVIADRWFASSKTCSGCGHVKDILDLSERVFCCGACGLALDRDHNAAINLARWPELHLEDFPPLEAAA